MKRFGILALLTACLAGGAAAQTKIILAHTGIADYAAAYIAKEEGLFRKHGLDVELQAVPAGALVSGLQADAAQISSVPPPAMLQAIDNGIDMVAVAGCSVITRGEPNPAIVVSAGSAVRSAQDLAGKRVAMVGLGGTLHVLTRKWLRDQGVDERKVGFVETAFPQMADLLKGGSVDAAVMADPFLGRALQSGAAAMLTPLAAHLPDSTTGVFYGATRKWATSHPAEIKAFREAIAEAVALSERNPDTVRAVVGKYTRVPAEALARMRMPKLVADVTEEQLRFWVETMRGQGMIKGNPNTAALIVR